MTTSQWDDLNEKAQWDIKVALRGPDSYYGETLKWFTTSVIRGQMKGVFRVGGTVNSDLQLIIIPSDGGYSHPANKYSWNARHFIEHVSLAAEWLHIPRFSIDSVLWHDVMCFDSARKAARLILEQPTLKESHKEELKRHYESGKLNF